MERGEAHDITGIEQPTAQDNDSRVQDSAPAEDRQATTAAPSPGLEFPRFFTLPGVDPFDEVTWEQRSAVIGNERGEVVFEQRDVEIPSFWSQQATNIVVSKYFRGQIGTPERESSVKQLIGRVVNTITAWGKKDGYFASEADLDSFSAGAEAHPGVSEGGVQQPRLVQLRLREEPAVLGVLHQLRAGHDGLDPDAGAHRGHALQVRIRHGLEPVGDPIVKRSARRRRHRVRSGVVHEGLRRVCGRHQVGRQDAPRGEDGHPQRRPSRTSSSSSTARSRKRRRRGR